MRKIPIPSWLVIFSSYALAMVPRSSSSRGSSSGLNGRRQLLERVMQAALVGSAGSVGGLLVLQAQRMGVSAGLSGTEWQDPLTERLRSSTGAAARQERALLEASWQELREEQRAGLLGRPRAEAALDVVMRVRDVIVECEELARTRRIAEIDARMTKELVRELEAAATVLASSTALPADAREAIGWQWGACGFKRCGAQADAAQALCKLRANLGMVVPLEALFYLDIAKRAVDEMAQLGLNAGLLPASSALPADRGYMSRETLEMILPPEDVETGGQDLPVMRGGNSEAEDSLEEYENSLLEELNRSSDVDGDG